MYQNDKEMAGAQKSKVEDNLGKLCEIFGNISTSQTVNQSQSLRQSRVIVK